MRVTNGSSRTEQVYTRTATTWALYGVLGLFAYLETAIGPATPFLRDKLDLSYTAASAHFSFFAVGIILSGVFGDRVVERIGRRNGLWGGIAGMTIGLAILGLSPVVIGSLLGVFLMGIAGTIALVSNQSILADLYGSLRTAAIAESNVVASTAAICAPLAVGGFARYGPGWEAATLVSIPALLLLYLKYRACEFPDHRNRGVAERVTTGRLPRSFWIVFIVLFLAMSVEWCVAFWGADFLASDGGMSNTTAATAMSVFFGAMIAGRLLGSRLARRFRDIRLLQAALLVALVGFPIFLLANESAIKLIGLFVAGVGIANFYPLTVATGAGLAPEIVDQATTRLAISGGSALLITPLVVGAIADRVDLSRGLSILIPILVLALLLAGLTGRSSPDAELPRESVVDSG